MAQAGAPLSLLTALGLAPLNVGQLVAGRSELAGRWVHWVNVLHWPASDAVRRGDLVLTTAVAPDRRDARQFLCEVIASPAAALVISMPSDVRLTGMLPEIVELAVERNFPVVLLPWEVPFADVTRALLTRLLTPAGARVGRSEAGLGKGAAVREPPATGSSSAPEDRDVVSEAGRRSSTLDGPGVGAELLRASSRRSHRVRVQVGLGYPPERRAVDWARRSDLFLARVEAIARRHGTSVRVQRSDEVLLVVLEDDAGDGPSLRTLLEQSGHGATIAHWVVTDTDAHDGETGDEIEAGAAHRARSAALLRVAVTGVIDPARCSRPERACCGGGE